MTTQWLFLEIESDIHVSQKHDISVAGIVFHVIYVIFNGFVGVMFFINIKYSHIQYGRCYVDTLNTSHHVN